MAANAAEVDDGLWHLPVPLPGHGIGHVNVYALVGEGGIALIDTGWALPACREALEAMLAQIGATLADVRLVLLTHLHADHCGMAGILQAAGHTRVAMHPCDAEQLVDRYVDQEPFLRGTRAWLAESGAPEEMRPFALRQVADVKGRFAECDPEPIADGQEIAHGRFRLTAFHTPGHSPGHICFFDKTTRILFSGDTVFDRVNYSPTYRPLSSPDPVGEYTDSLDRLGSLDVDVALPGHHGPVADFADRVAALRHYHARKSVHVRELVADGSATVWEVASRLTRSRPWGALRPAAQLSAVGETYAHLVRLSLAGEVRVSGEAPRRWTAN